MSISIEFRLFFPWQIGSHYLAILLFCSEIPFSLLKFHAQKDFVHSLTKALPQWKASSYQNSQPNGRKLVSLSILDKKVKWEKNHWHAK